MIYHLPVMPKEVAQHLVNDEEGVYVDCTLGGGGHSEYLLDTHGGIKIIGIDKDEDAVRYAAGRLARFGERVWILKGDFKDIDELSRIEADPVREALHQNPLAGAEDRTTKFKSIRSKPPAMMDALSNGVKGFILDLGISSHQVDEPERGFSFKSRNLDMRMDRGGGITAQDIINTYPREELSRIFFEYGEERSSRQIAEAVVEERSKAKITSAARLAGIVDNVKKSRGRINSATLVFQALRIAVNDELGSLKKALSAMPGMLSPGGRIVVLSYHSLEDRTVKQFFKENAGEGPLKIITKKVLCASPEEQRENPRSRSAKLRCAERVLRS